MTASIGTASLKIVPSFDNLGKSVTNALKGVNTGETGAASGASYAQAFNQGSSKGILGAGAIMGAVSAVTTKAISTVASSVSGAISRLDTLNNYPQVMQTLGYSADEASASVSLMSERLKGLPTSLNAMASTVQGIVAITGDLNTATDVGLALNDMLVASGAGTQVAASAMEQFRQILAKGKPEMQDWRSLTTAMPGQMAQLAQAMLGAEATANDLYAALGGGGTEATITMEQLMAAIVKLDKEGGDGITAFAEQAKTASGGIATSMENMQTAVVRGVASIFESLGSDNIKNFFTNIGAGFEGALKYVGEVIAEVKQPIVDSLTPVIEAVQSFATNVASKIKEPLVAIVKTLAELLPKIAPVAAGLLSLGLANKGIQTLSSLLIGLKSPLTIAGNAAKKVSESYLALAMRAAEGSLKQKALLGISSALGGAMGGVLTLGIGAAVGALGLLTANIVEANKKNETFKKATEGLVEATKGASEAVGGVGDAFNSLKSDTATKSVKEVRESIDSLIEKQAELAETIKTRNQAADSDVALLQVYQDTIKQYANQTSLTKEEQEKFAFAISQVNEMCGTQYQVIDKTKGIFADERGEIQQNTDAIEENIEARKKQAKIEAISENLKDIYKQQIEAQHELQDAYASYNRTQQDAYNRLSDEQKALADNAESWKANNAETREAQKAIDKAREAFDSAKAAADNLAQQLGDVSTGVEGISAAMLAMGDSASQAVVGSAGTMEAFAKACVDAGITTQDLNSVGSENIRQLAENCNGNLELLISGIQLYNSTPLIDKDGKINVDEMQLVDALGNMYRWEDSELKNQNGEIRIYEVELVDALGNIYKWDGANLTDHRGVAVIDDKVPISQETLDKWNVTDMGDKDAVAEITGNMEAALALVERWNSVELQPKTTYMNVIENISKVYASENAKGGIRVNAAGGYRYHATGAIAKSAVPLDIVGEDGAEAIVPLTNKKYAQPFIDLLTDGILNGADKGADASKLIQQITDSLGNMAVYLDGNKMVGYMARGMNNKLGKMQRMGAMA